MGRVMYSIKSTEKRVEDGGGGGLAEKGGGELMGRKHERTK